jgi:hypothetical protein
MIKTPRCPECGKEPGLILADGQQCFCPSDDCPVITWNSHLTAEENRADIGWIDLEEKP